jgi:hypothetical protein
VKHHNDRGSELRCNDCADYLKRKGQTSRDQELYKCMACPEKKGRAAFGKNTLISIDGKNNICLYVVIAMRAKRRYLRSCGHQWSGSVTRNVNADLAMSTPAKHIHIGMDTLGMRATVLRGKI